jgi:hypothetical protein
MCVIFCSGIKTEETTKRCRRFFYFEMLECVLNVLNIDNYWRPEVTIKLQRVKASDLHCVLNAFFKDVMQELTGAYLIIVFNSTAA